jgi:hypothetical protein
VRQSVAAEDHRQHDRHDQPQPDNTPFALGLDPHTMTAYTSPNTGKAMGRHGG